MVVRPRLKSCSENWITSKSRLPAARKVCRIEPFSPSAKCRYLLFLPFRPAFVEEGLDTLNKGVTIEQNLRAVRLLKEIGIMFEFGFMLFDPSTTFESVRENVSFLRSIVGDGSAAAKSAGVKRFRPILLTTLTTVAGLLPLLLEKSLQAQVLIPLATNLAFGLAATTFVALFLVPALYCIAEDIRPGEKPVLSAESADGAV